MKSEENIFGSFTDAYCHIVNDLLAKGEWVEPQISTAWGTGRGEKSKELLVYTFCVTDPRARDLSVSHRSLNKKFAFANFLWTLTGESKGDDIIRYNPKGKNFLTSSGDIPSAIGPHIFKYSGHGYQHFQSMVDLLTENPSTRRAVIQLFEQNDLFLNNADVSCFNHMQFFVRGKKLHCHVVMRSQSALMVLPYDFFLFSLLHEALAVRIHVPVGHLYYTANSMHIYESEIGLAKKIRRATYLEQVQSMRTFDNETIKKLVLAFQTISDPHDSYSLSMQFLDRLDFDEYWLEMFQKYFEIS